MRRFFSLATAVFILALLLASLIQSQITDPSSIEFDTASYQVTHWNVSGTALNWSGWNLAKKSVLNRPATARVIVEARSGNSATYNYTVNYFGEVYSARRYGASYAAFWIPENAASSGSRVPDSLFYVVPDSAGMAAGNEFYIASSKINAGDQYVFRLIFDPAIVKGTASVNSQAVWIGYGVKSMMFGYQPADTIACVYRALYATSYGGAYSAFISSDTLADSTWTVARQAGAWSHKAITGIDNMPWLKVQRIGLVAADTVAISGEELIIQSE